MTKYDADAIDRALTLPRAEQRDRMASLRVAVRELNVQRRTGRMLTHAARSRAHQRIEARVTRLGSHTE